jgi:predicted branched-subunit amino acid permease
VGYRRGVRLILPVAVAGLAFAVSFGVLARAAGMGTFAPIAMSATTFGGSAQFAAVSVLGDGGSVAAAIVAAVLLNLRYLPIGISVARGFVGGRSRRLAESQLVVDESWAVSVGSGGFDRRVLVGAGALLYACWVGGTALGVVGGGALGDPNRFGLDAAFPALFLALVAPRLRERRALSAAVLGGALAAALIPLVPPGIPIVAASGACLLGWRRA